VTPSVLLPDLVEDYFYTRHYKMFPVEDGHLIGCVTLRDLKEVPRDRWQDTAVRAIARPCSDLDTIGPDADALEALTTMHRTQNRRLMVAEGDRLIGVLTLKDMLEFSVAQARAGGRRGRRQVRRTAQACRRHVTGRLERAEGS